MSMLGCSVYLSSKLSNSDFEYLKQMKQIGCHGVFTSLHIPEDDPQVLIDRVTQLGSWCRQLNLNLIADISDDGFARLQWRLDEPDSILASGVTGLRIDYGISMQAIATLTHAMPVALNASTLTQADVEQLQLFGANFKRLEAWHNYYPRPETGLARDWFDEKNHWLHQLGITTQAFIPGDGGLRGPLFQRLPTLEAHRIYSPLAAFVELIHQGVDRIYIGDKTISKSSQVALSQYLTEDVISLHLDRVSPVLQNLVWHNRPDVARDVVRLEEGRTKQLLDPTPRNADQPRLRGSLTVDNERYGRYAGELQLTKCDLLPDEKVNVLGRVCVADRPLLDLIGANTAIQLIQEE
jgi:hypothetical protein